MDIGKVPVPLWALKHAPYDGHDRRYACAILLIERYFFVHETRFADGIGLFIGNIDVVDINDVNFVNEESMSIVNEDSTKSQ
jgi:hypothetical protein